MSRVPRAHRRLAIAALTIIPMVLAVGCVPPPTGGDSTSPPWIKVGCNDLPNEPGYVPRDLTYLGPVDTVDNAKYWVSTDGTCSGLNQSLTIVRAATAAQAAATCAGLHLDPPTDNLYDQMSIALPADGWICIPWIPVGCNDLPDEPDINYVPRDLEWLGPVDTVDNATFWASSDGTCSAVWSHPITIVRAATAAVAAAACEALDLVAPNANLEEAWSIALPADGWFCNPWLEPGCFDMPVTGGDLQFLGQANVVDNTQFWSSTDGTCTGSIASLYTMVRADTQDEADDDCVALGERQALLRPHSQNPDLPEDAWLCLNW